MAMKENCMKFRPAILSAALTTAVLATTQAQSPDTAVAEDAKALPELVVVATSHEREVLDLPWTAYFLQTEEPRLRLSVRNFPEVLSDVPGIMLQKTGNGMTSPYLRGLTGQRTVLMADGVRVNNSFLREGPNQYWNLLNPFFYDQVEVLMGPASVLYGSDAIGGVVYARSKPLLRGTPDSGFQLADQELFSRWSSAEASFSEYATAAFSFNDRWSGKFGISHQDFGELRTGESTENPMTNYEQWGANLRLRYWFDDQNSFIIGYDHFDQDNVDRVHKTMDYVPFHGSQPGSDDRRVYDHDRRAAFVRYEHRNPGSWLEELDLGLSYQYILENYFADRTTAKNRFEYRTTRIETLGLNLHAQSPSAVGTWTYGADIYHDIVSSFGHNIKGGVLQPLVQGPVGDDADYTLAGIYVQNELPLAESWELITGLRYTYADLEARKVNIPSEGLATVSGHWDALTGSARLMWHVLDNQRLSLYAGVTQGFRAPNLSDATRDDEFGGGTEKPTANLDEERFTTYELGAKSQADWGQFAVALYRTDIDDRIGRFEYPEATKRNVDNGYIQGIELSGLLNLSADWALFGSLAWQEGYEDSYLDSDITKPIVERPMSRMMPLSGQLGLRWAPADSNFWAEFVVDAADNQDKLADAEKTDNRFPPDGTPGYAVASLRGGWRINEYTEVGLALENLTDLEYRIHGSGVNEPGRNLIVTLRLTY